MSSHITCNAWKLERIARRGIGTINGCYCPIIARLSNSSQRYISDMLRLPNGVSKSTYWMAQLLPQNGTALSHLTLHLCRIRQVCQNGMMHRVRTKSDPATPIHLSYLRPCQ